MTFVSPPDGQNGQPYPSPLPQQAPLLPPRRSASGLAIAAFVVGIAAFLTGLVVGVGLVLGLAGVGLAIFALRQGTSRGFSLTGLILSALATLTNIVVIVLLVVLGPAVTRAAESAARNLEAQQAQATPGAASTATQAIDTPCYSFTGPGAYINDIGTAAIADCSTQLELWGDRNADGTVTVTGVGEILGTVTIEPIRTSTSDTWGTDGTIDGIVDYMNESYIPQLGTVITLKEPVALDGLPANLTRVQSTKTLTKTKALLVTKSASPYPTSAGDVQVFSISFVIPQDNGDAIIQELAKSWTWK